MPRRAQDRIGRGPFGALLILLGLLLGSGPAAAGLDTRQSAPRLGSSRNSPAVALLPAAIRNSADEDSSAQGGGASLPPSGPTVVTGRLWVRPVAQPVSTGEAGRAPAGKASYRARAPPAA